MNKPAKPVSSFLQESASACRMAGLDLGFGRSAAIWTNQDDQVRYEQLEGHTFSFYSRGGQGVWRVDGKPVHGWPGAVCIFPQGQSSEWLISTPLEMVHLYLPDEELRRAYSEMFDRDGRLLDVADVTYAPAGQLARPFQHLNAAIRSGETLRAEGAMLDLVGKVFARDRFCDIRLSQLKGGLASVVQKRVVEFIETHLDQTIRLQDLSLLAGLSEYHFQRSFKQSCGVSPHVWIAHRRIVRAKALIRANEPLSQIAACCGFSSQSHLTRSFKSGVGVTPAAYRDSVVY